MIGDSRHVHLRKRNPKHLEPYPSPNALKRNIDRLVYIAGIAGPVMALPQLWTIWVHKNVAGLSLFTWASFAGLSAVWLLYGILHDEKPIILAQLLWVVLHLSVVVSIILYRS
ncbi:MAG: hypothetical protein HY536_00670 [Candidatus Colwellbacteria bacterium]|nr:hypothetical protein [Candidatus Colwellbacteria bacterium]